MGFGVGLNTREWRILTLLLLEVHQLSFDDGLSIYLGRLWLSLAEATHNSRSEFHNQYSIAQILRVSLS